jgi:hypothetical protein
MRRARKNRCRILDREGSICSLLFGALQLTPTFIAVSGCLKHSRDNLVRGLCDRASIGWLGEIPAWEDRLGLIVEHRTASALDIRGNQQ